MIKTPKHPFLENLCVLLFCHDAQIDDFMKTIDIREVLKRFVCYLTHSSNFRTSQL